MALGVGLVVLGQKQRQRMEDTYARVCRDHGLAPTDQPLGRSDAWLVQHELLPRGDRDCSAVWGMQSPTTVDCGGTEVAGELAVFEWWWEDRQTHRDSNGSTRTTWERRSVLVGLIRLPGWRLPRVRVEGEGVLSRLGIGGRGDFQVESEEFNKRYDVRVADPQAAIRLFDAGFQQAMLGTFAGTTFELEDDLVLVAVPAPRGGLTLGTGGRRGGATGFAALFDRSGDRIATDPGLLEALPGVGARARALVATMPADWWRAVAGGGTP